MVLGALNFSGSIVAVAFFWVGSLTSYSLQIFVPATVQKTERTNPELHIIDSLAVRELARADRAAYADFDRTPFAQDSPDAVG